MTPRFVSTVLKTASMAAVPLVILAASVPAAAQSGQRMLFEWRGDVDQEVRIQMQNGRTDVMPIGPRESVGYDNAHAIGSVPSVDGYVSVRMLEGRGVADVVQQPRAQNGFTTIVRIRDGESGRGQYDIQAFWQPNGNYGNYGNGNYNVGNDRAYNDGSYNYDPYYDPYYNGQYDGYGNYGGGYGAYGAYGAFGGYGGYGSYGGYPRTVIVQRPVQRPVYVGRQGVPRPPVVVVNPSGEGGRRGVIPPGFPVPRIPRQAPVHTPVRAPAPHVVRAPAPRSQSYHHTDSNHHGH